MKSKLRSKLFAQNDDLAVLEAYLLATMTPVDPRPEFVIELGQRLLENSELPDVEADFKRKSNTLQYILFGGAGVVSSILIVITGIRAVNKLNNSVRQARSDIAQKQAAPAV